MLSMIDDKKLFVFDLDNTLYLWNVDDRTRMDYEQRLSNFLHFLKWKQKRLAIASFHTDPEMILKRMGIHHLFDVIIGRNRTFRKDDMLCNIMEITNCKPNDTVFFDDMYDNVRTVRFMGIECVLVNQRRGIDLVYQIS